MFNGIQVIVFRNLYFLRHRVAYNPVVRSTWWKPMPRLNFSLRTLLVISVVFGACFALNLRPTYPNAPSEPTQMSGGASFVFAMREYGWPWGCVHADLKTDWDAPDDEFATIYRVGDVFWLPLCANIAVPTVVCVLLIFGMPRGFGRLPIDPAKPKPVSF